MELVNTVLIVDDSQTVLKTLGFMIKKAGHDVLTANDGKMALELLDGRNIDLIFTDFNMPGMNGIELTAQVRLSAGYQYTPIVVFIPDSEPKRSEIISTSGATMLFDKSNIREKFLATVQKLLD